jgi:hypothetical protein
VFPSADISYLVTSKLRIIVCLSETAVGAVAAGRQRDKLFTVLAQWV